ncbi:MAG: carboxylating nicotinate-nucleotide diphosphorylase [Bacteroidales bacterium]|nr:carboxylating nicotinate-nucleotide diphosphorylase [Bacteroidales bacterium]
MPQSEALSQKEIIRLAMLEDLGSGDHTSLATISKEKTSSAQLLIKENCILAGTGLAREVFYFFDPELTFIPILNDGNRAGKGDVAFTVSGSALSILSCERTVLNFMQRLSGIATYTGKLAGKISGYKSVILDTRKTTPLLRALEKYAVRTGGAGNHRMGLYDMIMIKDNHVDFCGGIENAIEKTEKYLKEKGLDLKIEIEVRNFSELERVLATGKVNRIMLDNFTPGAIKKALARIGGKYETETSGGITEENIEQYAATGVDYISIGALTHHIKSIDMSLKAIPC